MERPYIGHAAVDPGLNFTKPGLQAFVDYWDLKRGDRPMPARQDMDVIEMREHLGWLMMLDVLEPRRLRFRLIGSQITQALGRDNTGRYLDEVYPAASYDRIVTGYLWTVDNRRPIRMAGTAQAAGKDWLMFEAVDLPLSDDGIRVNRIITRVVFY